MACTEHADNPQPSWCAECMETEPTAPAPLTWSTDSPPFVAKFAGDCASCSGRFLPSVTLIVRWVRGQTPNAEFVYTHVGCRP